MTTDAGWVWDALGIGVTGDVRAIKRAYAARLKLTRPDDDADGFQLLRDAYQAALRYAEYNSETAVPAATLRIVPQWSAQTDADADPAPAQAAQMAWQSFIAAADNNPRAGLHHIAASALLLSFPAREAFELLALHHAARADCGDVLRDAIVEHFDWAHDGAHIERLDSEAAGEAVGRYRAAQSYDHFRLQPDSNGLIGHLLETSVPTHAWSANDRSFTQGMQQLLAAIRWQHPDLLHYRLNADVFSWWEQRLAKKKYFTQTAVFSLMLGLVAFFVAVGFGDTHGTPGHPYPIGSVFLGCMLVSFALPPLLIFSPLRGLGERWARFKEDHLDAILYIHRYNDRVQHGWLMPFALLSMLLFVRAPNALARTAIATGFGLTTAWALFATWPLIGWLKSLSALALGGLAALGLMACGFDAIGLPACAGFGACAFLLGWRGGQSMYILTGLSDAWLMRLRVGWLAGAAPLYLLADADALPAIAVCLAGVLWCVVGLLLSRISLSLQWVWPALVGGRFVVQGFGTMVRTLPDPRFAMIVGAMVIIALSIVNNIVYAVHDERTPY